MALAARDGIEDFGHAVADVIAHDVFDEQGRKENTHHGEYQIEPVGRRGVEVGREQVFDLMDEPFQDLGRQCCAYAHQKTEHQNVLTWREVFAQIGEKPLSMSTWWLLLSGGGSRLRSGSRV